jgi:hypothetical protein
VENLQPAPVPYYVELTDEQWDEEYSPINNPFEKDVDLFETYGDALEFIQRMPEEHVWTQVDGDDGGLYIVNGFHYVNRIDLGIYHRLNVIIIFYKSDL